MLAESIVLELCRSGALDRNIEFVKGALRERRDTLVEALGEHLAEAEFVVPGGGYFLWLDLAEGTDTRGAPGRGRRRPALPSSPGPTSCSKAARRACASPSRAFPPQRIGEGVERISAALERVAGGHARLAELIQRSR